MTDTERLMHRYLLGQLDKKGLEQLDRALLQDHEQRATFQLMAQVDTALRERGFKQTVDQGHEIHPRSKTRSVSIVAALLATAASLLLLSLLWRSGNQTIATLSKSENAAWQSDLPTSPGAKLGHGILNLRTGLATLQFASGAVLTLEAPSQLELVSAMHAKLNSGAAVVHVPESATGFRLDTPQGHVIDYGTRFAVQIYPSSDRADFELIDGEIEVHHRNSGDKLRLTEDGTAATASPTKLVLVDADDAMMDATMTSNSMLTRLEASRCGTAMPRSHKRHKFIDPEVLSVKRSGSGKWDFRSFFQFELTSIEHREFDSVRLRLNLVPSTRGVASRLPLINRFAIYGLTNPGKSQWIDEPTWEQAPGPEDGVLLGKFEIERSRSRGTFGIETPQLRQFVRQNAADSITLILVRETEQIDGMGVGLTHMFASNSHPESVGPMLELRTHTSDVTTNDNVDTKRN